MPSAIRARSNEICGRASLPWSTASAVLAGRCRLADAPPLRCAVIGAGRMGMVHGHLLQVYPGTELVGFADPQPGARERLSSQGLTAPVFVSVAALVSASSPDCG